MFHAIVDDYGERQGHGHETFVHAPWTLYEHSRTVRALRVSRPFRTVLVSISAKMPEPLIIREAAPTITSCPIMSGVLHS